MPLRSVSWIGFNFVLAAAGGAFLAWGPLHGGYPLMSLIGGMAGLLVGGLWGWQQWAAKKGHVTTARRWWRVLIIGQLVIVGSIAVLTLNQLYRTGAFPPITQDRISNFERLWSAINDHYPYFELKGIDWTEVYDRYQPRVADVQSDAGYTRLVATMLAEMNDAHTGLRGSISDEHHCAFGFAREMEGQAVMTVVGAAAQAAGLNVGTVIVTIDGQPVAQAIEQVDDRYQSYSTPWQRRAGAFNHLLRTLPGGTRQLTFLTPGGAGGTATLFCPEQPEQRPTGEWEIWEHIRPVYEQELIYLQLPSGWGYIRLTSFRQNQIAEFDVALAALMNTPGLILDLRGNGGGNTRYALPIAGRFLGQPVLIGREFYHQRLPQRGWRLWLDYRATPRPPVYSGPLVLLIDGDNMSTTEQFILALTETDRAQTVGRRTGGATGNPIVFQLAGGRQARFSTGDFRRSDGIPVEGVGLMPTVPVAWTLDDFHGNRDPDLELAESLLSGDGG